MNIVTQGAAHPIIMARGIKAAWTPAGWERFKQSGAPRELASTSMTESIQEGNRADSPVKRGIAAAKFVLGAMYNGAELGVRNMSYNIGLEAAKVKGLSGDDAFFYAMNEMHRAQFRYGKVGMPMGLRGWGGVTFQYSSYKIKQTEFILDVLNEARQNPREGMPKLAGLIGMQVALPLATYMAGVDLSGASFIPGFTSVATVGDLYKAAMRLKDSDYESAMRHFKMAVEQSDPIKGWLPVGPVVKSITDFFTTKDSKLGWLMQNMDNTQARRFREMAVAFRNQENGEYPIYTYPNDYVKAARAPFENFEIMDNQKIAYRLDLPTLLQRTFFIKSSYENQAHRQVRGEQLLSAQTNEIVHTLHDAMMQSDGKTLDRLMRLYPMQTIQAVNKNHGAMALQSKLEFERTPSELAAMKSKGVVSTKQLGMEVIKIRDEDTSIWGR
jgi:hypothetical protein